MRPAGRGALESLYFNYPRFSAPARRPDRANARIVIIGAGPVGLTAALELARHGVGSLVIERKDTFNDGSRAICIARQSFHILEQIGAVAPFLDKSLGWTTGRSFFRGRQFLEFRMPHSADEKYLPMYNLEQQFIEQYLFEAASRSPLIEIRWQSELVSIGEDGDTVCLTVRDPQGDYRISADWVLAADGARSAVRTMRGLRLTGENFEGRYVIADIRMQHDYPTIRRALFDPACRPGGTVLIHRQPDDIWRVDYQLEAGETNDEAMREENLRRNVAGVLAEIGHKGNWDLEWWSVYSANTLCLDDYRDGRIFYIGDSAHIVPIFGVRGLNNGLADAQNIGWKLALVVNGTAAAGLLDSYSPERRGATLDVFANAVKSTRFMTPPSRGYRLLRDASLALAAKHAFAAEFANPRQMRPYSYGDSKLTTPAEDHFESGPEPGEVMANVALDNGDFLTDRIGPDFTLLVFCSEKVGVPIAQATELIKDFPGLRIVAVNGNAATSGIASLRDPDGRIAARYAATPGAAILIRPDQHVAARWRRFDSGQAKAAIGRALGRS